MGGGGGGVASVRTLLSPWTWTGLGLNNKAENLENEKLLTAFLEHEKNQSWQEMYSRIYWIKHDVFGSQDMPDMSERLVIFLWL